MIQCGVDLKGFRMSVMADLSASVIDGNLSAHIFF